MLKGDRCPFDTAVSINIGTYRQIRQKLTLCDQLIPGLQKENNVLQLLNTVKDSLNSICQEKIDLNRDMAIEKQKSLMLLSKQYDVLFNKYDKTQTWWHRNAYLVGFGSGVVFTIGAGVLIYLIVK